MKTIKTLFTAVICLLLLSLPMHALQAEATPNQKTTYLTVTKLHWNMDMKDFDMDTWKSIEKEYLNKVVRKNEHILSASYYLHQMTPDSRDVLYVQSFASWNDIEKSWSRSAALEKEAWTNEKHLKEFRGKKNAYFDMDHSDEIYVVLPHTKPLNSKGKDMICYIRTNHMLPIERGSTDEIRGLITDHFDKMIKDNHLIKGYYTFRHAWGSDGSEMVEAYFFDSMTDMDSMFEGMSALEKKMWPNEKERKDRIEKFKKYFTPVHGDAVFKYIADLSK
ncbi:hypothetical protein JJL45_04560 [Tamlana sp. s12]|uniref:hypothetical protein n=1 Tax=Tamlana sp. s12 TaxID=1630406 RepID=UPI00192A7A9B|nr:hypothetical protein [Tamlana sp. s12]QQY83266.1 hypothetical protein JJL45_04560 [Tamlana sp. s12]